jgi:4-amino-4-deoxy-L-arabinose transferase-like glycosyltransferase
MKSMPEGNVGDAESGGPALSRWTCKLAIALLIGHGILLGLSLPRNAVTIDEVVHLPAGLSYWHQGQFWCYHHNPPLVKLLFSLPAVLADIPTDYRHYRYLPGSRGPDCELGKDFMLLNGKHYIAIFAMSRAVVAMLSVLGGYLVFRWSRRLFGDAGGLISLSLWTFCPNILAHAGLVTPDVGSTVFALLASYQFWRYLQKPTMKHVALAGVLLGLAEASKFSSVFLPPVWALLGTIKVWLDRRSEAGPKLDVRRALFHAAALGFIAMVILNDVYLGEGFGMPLGEFEFRSKLLTKEIRADEALRGGAPRRENRFRGTALGRVPMPFPEHYLLGFDDQTFDVDTGDYYKYLRGDLRRGDGWYHYYLYCLLVKSPIGTLGLLGATAVAGIALRRCRTDPISELSLLLPLLAVMILVSSQRGMNSHLRYILPAFPFAFISAGRLGPLVAGSRARSLVVIAALAATAASVVAVHPHYLTYFNEVAGGPDRGLEHLADSNIDWGQGLVSLRDWLARNAPGRKIKLAYFGTMYPEVLGIPYELPPLGPEAYAPERAKASSNAIGPVPGLQAVSANYLLGIPFPAPNSLGSQSWIPLNSYRYYRKFRPMAIVAHSIFVFDLSPAEVDRARRELGLPPWAGDAKTPGGTAGDGHVGKRKSVEKTP